MVLRTSKHRRLISTSSEATGRGRGQDADVTGPRDALKLAGGASHPGHHCVAAKPRKGPVERPREPWRAVLVPGDGCAGPLTAAVEEPDAREAELIGNSEDLCSVFGVAMRQPSPGQAIDHGQHPDCEARERANALVPQRPRPCAALNCVTDRAAIANVYDGHFAHVR